MKIFATIDTALTNTVSDVQGYFTNGIVPVVIGVVFLGIAMGLVKFMRYAMRENPSTPDEGNS